ncbi:MAG TPA: insulinase family protein [Allosphingosinicella sp.]|jgi:zinc protease
MPLLRSLLLALALLVSAPASAQQGDADWLYRGSDIARDPAWRFGTLPNGLRYAVRRNGLPAGQVSIRMRVEVGALHEEDAEQGWAHFVEHMLFRGTASFADREARHIWQRLGASFGSDTNATTGATQTVYQLDLPRNDRESLDTSLQVLSEMASSALFDPATVEAERRVILAEKERQPELQTQLGDLSRSIFWRGLRIADRNIIGSSETLAAANAERLKGFYRRWYRPERATIVMVGDAAPEEMEALIRARFGGWRGAGPAPAEPALGSVAGGPPRVAPLVSPGAPTAATLLWVRPHEALPHTEAREQLELEETLATRILNRRLEARARQGGAFIGASVGIGRSREAGDATSLSVTAHRGRWREALNESWAIVADAMRAPPSESEIARELQNMRAGIGAAVLAETTRLSQGHADQMIDAIDDRDVVARAETVKAVLERAAPLMIPTRVGARMRSLFEGSGPHLVFLTPDPVATAELSTALETALRAAPAERQAERRVSLDELPALGPPGRETSRETIPDLGVTIIRFENGATLTFKRTAFERGEVDVQLRFGGGLAAMAPDRPSLAWLAGLIGPSGLAGFDLDAVERMLTGRRMSMAFALDEDAFVLSGRTNPAELTDELRLLAAKVAHPRWDPALFSRFRSASLESFNLHFSSAAARGQREFGGIVRPGDTRSRPASREDISGATIEGFRAYFEPLLAQGPVHAVIVGDVELEAAVEAMRRTIAALPRRPEPRIPPGSLAMRPPEPNPRPVAFTHEGAADQAYAMIGWSTLGGTERLRERRALALAANIFRVRLFERLREAEGASYAPAAAHGSSETFPAWGVFYAAAELRPESVPAFFRAAREIAADMAANPVPADEFARAQNPVVSGIERRLATNSYWVGTLSDFAWRPAAIAEARAYLTDYRGLTAEDVRAAMARWVTDQGDWSMVVEPSAAARGRAAAPAPPAPASPRQP